MPHATIAAILKRGDLRLTPQERSALEAAGDSHPAAVKLLAADAFNTGAYARAVQYARKALAQDGSAENLANLVSSLRRCGQHDEAIATLLAAEDVLSPIRRASWLGETYAQMGRAEDAQSWGQKALELKDASVPAVAQPAAVLHRFDVNAAPRNVISFSLWGDNPRYLQGALRNALVAPYVYPGWTVRFYVDESVPQASLQSLLSEGAEIRLVPKQLPAARFGLFWRFLVEDDPKVALYLVRDADSVVSYRERRAVDDWLASGQPFHVMRDGLTHSELVLAGMWGAHRGNLPAMAKAMQRFQKDRAHLLNDRASDQAFLRQTVWPLMRGRARMHDRCFGWGDPFPEGADLPANRHVGQNEAVLHPNRSALPAPS